MQESNKSPRSTGFKPEPKEGHVEKQKKAPILVILLLVCITSIGIVSFFAIHKQATKSPSFEKRQLATLYKGAVREIYYQDIGEPSQFSETAIVYYAGMVSDSIFSISVGRSEDHIYDREGFNLYYPINCEHVKVHGYKNKSYYLTMVQITPERISYKVAEEVRRE